MQKPRVVFQKTLIPDLYMCSVVHCDVMSPLAVCRVNRRLVEWDDFALFCQANRCFQSHNPTGDVLHIEESVAVESIEMVPSVLLGCAYPWGTSCQSYMYMDAAYC